MVEAAEADVVSPAVAAGNPYGRLYKLVAGVIQGLAAFKREIGGFSALGQSGLQSPGGAFGLAR